MRKTRSAVKFIVRHHNLPKTKTKTETELQLRQPKVAQTKTATGNNTYDQRYYTGIALTRKGVAVVKWRRSVM